MEIPFITSQVHEGHYPINRMFQPEGWNGRPALVGTPGLSEHVDTTWGAEGRVLYPFGDYMYFVVGNRVYRADINKNVTQLTGTLDTTKGWMTAEDDGTNIMFVDGTSGYYIQTVTAPTTVTKITDADFPTPGSVTGQDGYFIVSSVGTQDWYINATSGDASSWDALDYESASGDPDVILSIISDHREVVLFGEVSTEVYFNSGAADFPFERIHGSFMEKGLGAKGSPAKLDNSVYFLADDFTVRFIAEYNPVIISPPALNQIIAGYSKKSDAIGYSYYNKGNAFYVLVFPSEDVTWVYNAATKHWHQWSSGINNERHRSNCYTFFKGRHFMGDFENGKIYELKDDVYTDDGETIKRVRVAPPVFGQNRERLFFNRLEIEYKAGVGRITGDDYLDTGTNVAPTACATDPYNDQDSVGTWTEVGNASIGAAAGGRTGYQLTLNVLDTVNEYGYFTTPNSYGNYKLVIWHFNRTGFNEVKGTVKIGTTQGGSEIGTLGPFTETTWTKTELEFQSTGDNIYVSLFNDVTVYPSLWDDLTLFGLSEKPFVDPQAILDWSDDGGRTWSNEIWTSIGRLGEYNNRSVWRRLGQSRNRLFRLTEANEVESVVVGAYADIRAGRN